jgi:putative nucleotidyltransferase with HDIG domain
MRDIELTADGSTAHLTRGAEVGAVDVSNRHDPQLVSMYFPPGAVSARSDIALHDDGQGGIVRYVTVGGMAGTESEYTAEHCLNVCILSIAFGRHLGMSEPELEKLGLCGLLHDVGKMRVPTQVLNKVEPLTEKKFNMIKAHTVHGRNLLMSSPGVPNIAVDVAYSHHERIDVEGYPRKLKASGISDFARIVAIVDAYDAMTADRCYSCAIPSTDALKRIFQDRGTQFDERLALEFIKSVGLYPPGSIVELVNGLVGIVLETNTRYRHLPKIIAVRDLNKPLEKERIIALGEIEQKTLDKGHLIKRALCDGSHGIFIREYREKGLMFKH